MKNTIALAAIGLVLALAGCATPQGGCPCSGKGQTCASCTSCSDCGKTCANR